MKEQAFIQHVKNKLAVLPDISAYNKVYLSRLIAELPYRTKIFHAVIAEVCLQTHKPVQDIVLVDYGGGTGLLSCYARWVGIGKVIYIDIFDQSAQDAMTIAAQLDLTADTYLVGEVSVLQTKPHALVSTDVIEHIYSLNDFFATCYRLNPKLIQVHITGANPYNPIIRRRLMALQKRNENEYHAPAVGAKPSDDYRAYKEIRQIWLQENYAQELSVNEIQQLVLLSRGCNFDDIRVMADDYLKNKQFPVRTLHPTNTCDPNTGNWSERLLSQEDLQSFCTEFGWQCTYEAFEFNNRQANMIKNFVWHILNRIGKMLGGSAKCLLPLLKITIKEKESLR